MTFRKPKQKTMNARALTDPRPRFVSLVQAGANQTPIRSIKMDLVKVEEDPMTTITALKAEGHEVKRITFKTGEEFADEAAVRTFLDEGGYDASNLKATDDGFEVTNEDNEFTDDIQVIKVNDGLTIEVGKLVATDEDEATDEEKADAQANKAGSVITDVKVLDTKDDGGTDEVTKDDKPGSVEIEDEDATREGQLVAGLDGSLKPIRKRVKPAADEGNEETTEKDQHAGDADCPPGQVLKDGKCVPTVAKIGDEVFQVLLDGDTVEGIAIPDMSFEVTEKVEMLSGDCGPGHTMLSVGGRSFCVPTGDRSPISQDTEVTAPAAGGGQGGASAGSTPVSGQTNRTEGDEGARDEKDIVLKVMPLEEGAVDTKTIVTKFDEFSAHFSDGLSLEEVMDDANDGFPPGLEMVILAAVMAMRNNFLVGDSGAVRKVGTDLGIVAARLGEMFVEVEKAESLKVLVDKVSGQFADLGWPQDEDAGQTDDETVTKVTGNGDAALVTALSEMATTMKAIADSVGEVRKTQEEQAAASAELADRVETVETLKQTKKSADNADAGTAIEAKVKKSVIADIALRGALGISQTAKS